MDTLKYTALLILMACQTVFGQDIVEQSKEGNSENLPIREYNLTIREEMVNKAGKEVKGMTVNGTIPGPNLEFTEGEYAVIYVKNEMNVETSVHWHGIIIPNFFDGVPYLTTPPIRPGETFKYEFPIRQAGTYWYHSHTMLQEQSGVFGGIVIAPKEESLQYDKDLVLMLSDWTNEKPINVLRNLKRGNDWYQMKKGTSTPLNQVIARGAFGAQLDFWRQRMEGADIADIYYPAFLVNGKQNPEYADFKPGEKVRLRIIDGSASSQFWMTFGGETPLLVSADGRNVVPILKNKTFIAVAETYDFILTIPQNGKIEFRAMAQDGSGTALAYIGKGEILPAEIVPRPDKIKMDHSKMKMYDMPMDNMSMFSEYNYDYLKSPEKTTYSKDVPVKQILLNLTGNMNRYIWSMNGVPLSETDQIKINHKEVTRITLNNLTMMHHPMHLHGHFFRVINKNGEYSPLKHTVNVPPMQDVTIEFYGNEYGDWFFHCHVLYHMMSGMARVFSYDTPRDDRLKGYPISGLITEADKYYTWAMVDAASHMTELNLVSSNIRNQFNLSAEYGWNQNLEAEVTYERYLHDYLRIFGGVNMENELEDSLDEISTTAILGIRYLTPYLFNLDVRIDNKLRPQIGLSREILIFPRTAIFGRVEYQADFGWVDNLPPGDNFSKEVTWNAGVEYFLSRNFSLMGSYDNRFGAGGGLSIRF